MTDPESNLKTIERLYALCLGGVWDQVPEILAEDFFITEAPGLPYAGVYRGKNGLRELFQAVGSVMELEGLDVIQMTAGGDWVFALMTMHARDADGPFKIELIEGSRFRDGAVAEMKPFYFDPAMVHRAAAAKHAAA